MKVWPSKSTPKVSKEPSNGEHNVPSKGIATLFARLRKLEQKTERMEARISTIQRDTWRIEKKQLGQIEALPPTPQEKAPALDAALFGGL